MLELFSFLVDTTRVSHTCEMEDDPEKSSPKIQRKASKNRGDTGDKDGTWKLSPYSLFQRRLITEQLGNMTVRSSTTMTPIPDMVSEWKLSMEQSKVACETGGDEVIHVKSDALLPELASLHSNDPAIRRSSMMRLSELQIGRDAEVALARSEVDADQGARQAQELAAAPSCSPRSPKVRSLKPLEGKKIQIPALIIDSPRFKPLSQSFPGQNSSSPLGPQNPWSPKSSRSSRRAGVGVKLRPVWKTEVVKGTQRPG